MSRATYIPDLLALLGDVAIVAPVSGHALVHNGTTWANRALTTSDVSGLGGLLASKANLTGGNAFRGTQTVATAGGSVVHTIDPDLGVVSFGASASVDTNTGTFAGNGSGLTSLPAANLTGTVPNARTTAVTTATANTIVQRDGGGNVFVNTANVATLQTTGTIGHNSSNTGIQVRGGSFSTAGVNTTIAAQTFSNSSGIATAALIQPTDSTTGTGGLAALVVDMLGSGTGSGSKPLIDLRDAGTSRVNVTRAGVLTHATTFSGSAGPTMTASGVGAGTYRISSSAVLDLNGSTLVFNVSTTEAMRIIAGGNTGIGTNSPSSRLDVNSNMIRLRTALTPTSTADITGNVGDIAADDSYLYRKTTSGWKRAALNTF